MIVIAVIVTLVIAATVMSVIVMGDFFYFFIFKRVAGNFIYCRYLGFEMKINVIPIQQETKRSCSVACLRMISAYYGKYFSENDIWKHCKLYNDSVFLLPDLAYSAIKIGFKAKLIGFNPLIIQKSQKELKDQIKERIKTNEGYGKAYAESYFKFLTVGGEIVIKIPTLEDINKALAINVPVILGIRPAILHLEGNFNQLHSIVIIGAENTEYIYIDPSTAKIEHVEKDRLLAAWYSRIPEMLVITNG
jgi:hypothetical protein